MKRTLIALLLLALAPAAHAKPKVDPSLHPVRVMTFNVRYANRKDGLNQWAFRHWQVASTIRFHNVDICGTQEVLGGQLASLHHHLPHMDSVATGRDGRAGGERCAIFYRRDRFERLRWATFWLSQSPEKPSRSWGSSLRRICTWIELKDKRTGVEFVVFNTHFDHRSANARKQSANLLVHRVAEIAGTKPVLLLGDLNCAPDSPPYRVLTTGSLTTEPDPKRALSDALHVSEHGHVGPLGTFSGFGGVARTGPRIDYVFTKNRVHIREHGILSGGAHDGRTASDHRPVLVEALLDTAPWEASVDLQARWRFQPDPKRVGEKRGWHTPAHDPKGWGVIHAGEPWERQGHPDLDGAAWFRRTVHVPESWRGKPVHFQAYGIDDLCTIWWNGVRVLGAEKPGTTRWERSTSLRMPQRLLRFGQDNVIVLRIVDQSLWGGLTGLPVRLTTMATHTTDYAEQFADVEILKRTGWHVHNTQTRTLTWPLKLPGSKKDSGVLRFCVGHSADDTGDRGCWFRLLDPDGNEVKAQYVRSRGDLWFDHPVTLGATWTLVIEDKDARLGGRHPGNGGSVEARLIYEAPR